MQCGSLHITSKRLPVKCNDPHHNDGSSAGVAPIAWALAPTTRTNAFSHSGNSNIIGQTRFATLTKIAVLMVRLACTVEIPAEQLTLVPTV